MSLSGCRSRICSAVVLFNPPGYPLSKVQKFVKKYPQKIPYLLAIDDESSLLKTFEVTVMPKTLLLNQKGEILYQHLGYDPSNEAEIEHAITSKL